MDPLFSIIIPALNEEHFIGTLLSAIKKQTFTDFEVVVVDAESEDKTVEVAKDFQKDFKLKIITTKLRNISGSRNEGAKTANGQYLFFIDSDNSILPTFLEDAKRLIDNKNCDMIIPSVVPDSHKYIYRFIYFVVNYLVLISRHLNVAFSTGGNLIIRRSKFELLNGFNKDIFVGEDHDIVKQAMKKRLKIVFLNNSKLIFSVRRLEKERFGLVAKYFISSIYIVFFGKITRKIYDYPMGGDYFEKNEK